MSYLIFQKMENTTGTLYRIAETQIDLDNLNINKTDYKIIEISNDDFNLVKEGLKGVLKYVNNEVIYEDLQPSIEDIIELENIINNFKYRIKSFTENNSNHLHFNKWNSYYDQLNNLNLNNFTFPLNKSLEQYFKDLGQPYYNILQIP